MIRHNILQSATRVPSPNRGGTINPKFIVMHYTASWEIDSVIGTFNNPASKVSAHITFDTDGSAYQHVPFNVKAWHAGPSQYAGYTGLNSHAIGIEIVNPGFCRMVGGKIFDADMRPVPLAYKNGFLEQSHPRVGSGTFYWPLYTERQLSAVEDLTKELIQTYSITDIVSHEEIDLRGWKTDPGPAFPMQRFKKLLNGRDLDTDTYEVTASSLNVRGGPGTQFKIIDSYRKGKHVSVEDRRGDWARVSSDGWVHGSFLRLV